MNVQSYARIGMCDTQYYDSSYKDTGLTGEIVLLLLFVTYENSEMLNTKVIINIWVQIMSMKGGKTGL